MIDPRKRRKKITAEQIEEALRKSGGFITAAAKLLGVSHANICQRIKRNKHLQKVRTEIEEYYIDMAETGLVKKILAEDFKAITFYLKNKGKSRGYTEKQELDIGGQEDNPVIFEVEYITPENKDTAARQAGSIIKPPSKI